MTKPKIGTCHLCGAYGKLSFEHVPPKRAFNDHPVIKMSMEAGINLGPDEPLKGETQQQGMGGYTLCETCNSKLGGWYVRRFIDWTYQGMELVVRSGGKPTLYYPYQIAPLAVIKQIAAMFLSVNPAPFGGGHNPLTEFVLNKEKQYLDPQYRFYTYYNIEGRLRSMPIMAAMNIAGSGTITLISEISYPPFGYVMTIDQPRPPDFRLMEITHFTEYEWGRITTVSLKLPTLPTHLGIPADYRDKKEIYEQAGMPDPMVAD